MDSARDEFAARAMQALIVAEKLAQVNKSNTIGGGAIPYKTIATRAYKMADAMADAKRENAGA